MAFQHQVFVSFSEEDTDWARTLAEALKRSGWYVWWYRGEERKLGENVELAVQEALDAARAAVVVWSKHSFGSKWVKSEAHSASQRGILVPVRIDDSEIPVPYNLDRTADLRDWRGDLDHPGFKAVIARIRDLAGSAEHLQQRIAATSDEPAIDDDDSHCLAPGTKVREYTIVRVLGQGGFGVTYLAEHGTISQQVALKEYLPTSVARRSSNRFSVKPLSTQLRENYEWGLDRFRQEAQTLVRLNHPNIVRVLNFLELNGTAYLAMEYQDGRSLANLIKDEPLDNSDILQILPGLLSGLETVHAAGIFHRDIKPGNIYLRRDGTPVLIDFGSARQAIAQRNRTTSMVRSEGYAPYEQYHSSGAIGAWTDLYALGATLYHCMVGAAPPPAPERAAAEKKQMADPVAAMPERLRGQYDERLCRAVVAALNVEEADRPQSVDRFRSLAGLTRRPFSKEQPSGGGKKAPPDEKVARQGRGKTPPPPKEAPPPGAGAKAGDGKERSRPPKVEDKAAPVKTPPAGGRPAWRTHTVTGASLGIGVGLAMLAGAFVRGDPNEFLLIVAGLGLTIGALYFMTWRGRLWASIALIILTFAVLAIGLLVFFGMFIADHFRLGAGLVAMAALAIGWTGIPLLANAIRGSRTEIETARDRAVSR